MFFDLLNTGRLARREILLCDVNPDLIGCYWTVRDRADDVIRELKTLAREYQRAGSECYYDVRDRRFNPARADLQSQSSTQQDVALRYTPELAAMLIFLNRTGFNGLFRLNRRGGFNVPAGRYTDPRICDETNIRSVAAALGQPRVSIELSHVRPDAGRHKTRRLRVLRSSVRAAQSHVELRPLHGGRFHVLRSVAAATGGRGGLSARRAGGRLEFERLGDRAGLRDAGRAKGVLEIRPVPARRAINSRASARGPVDELIISNVKRAALNAVKPRMIPAQLRERRRLA